MRGAGDGGEAGSNGPGREAGVNGGCGLRQYLVTILRSICGPTICGFYDRHKGKGFLTSHFSSDLNSVKVNLSEALPFAEHVPPRFELGIFMYLTCNSMNNLSSYCGLVDAKIRASDKDLSVFKSRLFCPTYLCYRVYHYVLT